MPATAWANYSAEEAGRSPPKPITAGRAALQLFRSNPASGSRCTWSEAPGLADVLVREPEGRLVSEEGGACVLRHYVPRDGVERGLAWMRARGRIGPPIPHARDSGRRAENGVKFLSGGAGVGGLVSSFLRVYSHPETGHTGR